MAIDPDVFKAYDIRGLYGSQLDADGAELIGRAFARVLAAAGGKPVAELRVGLGRDMRLSAPELAAATARACVAEGVHVIDAGQVGTEMLYYLVGSRELDGGLMCTASHNPAAYGRQARARRGAWRCRATPACRTSAARSSSGLGRGERGAAGSARRSLRRSTSTTSSSAAALVHRPRRDRAR